MSTPTLKWRRISPRVEALVEAILRSWLDTDHHAGQRVKGVGVDCAQLCPAFLDEAYQRSEPSPLRRLPPTTGIHDTRRAMETIHQMQENFPALEESTDRTIEAGDFILVNGEEGYDDFKPGHVLIAGAQPWTVYHASYIARKVVRTSLAATLKVQRVYRISDKLSWR